MCHALSRARTPPLARSSPPPSRRRIAATPLHAGALSPLTTSSSAPTGATPQCCATPASLASGLRIRSNACTLTAPTRSPVGPTRSARVCWRRSLGERTRQQASSEEWGAQGGRRVQLSAECNRANGSRQAHPRWRLRFGQVSLWSQTLTTWTLNCVHFSGHCDVRRIAAALDLSCLLGSVVR